MLTLQELAFVKAMATVKLSPPVLQELRKAIAAKKVVRTVGASKTKALTLPVSHRQRVTTKRKATQDAAGEPAARRPATEPLSQREAPADASAQRPCPEPSTSRGSTLATGGLAYATVVAGRTIQPNPSRPLKPIAKGSAHADPAATSEAALRRNSSELSGPLNGMPAGATSLQAPGVNVVPAGQRRNKTPIFVTGVSDTPGFLAWLRAASRSSLTAQIKAELLVLVSETADGFRAMVTALRSLDASRGVSFHTFSLPEDRSVRLLVKNLGKTMPESVVQEELAALGISVQGLMQLRSGRRSQDGAQDRPLNPTTLSRCRGAPRSLCCAPSPSSADLG
jgi:hypothetical protein